MEREQIIKALEICANYKGCSDCKDCPLHNDKYVQCEQNVLEGLALSLIKELTQANEMLSESYDHLEKTKDELLAERSRLTEEIEKLKKAKYIYATVDYCADDLAEALEEIKKLTEENEKLTSIGISKDIVIESINDFIVKLNEENERLKADNEALTTEIKKLLKAAWIVEADTVKKMQERLKAVSYQSSDWSHGEHPMVVEVDDIDQIAEEMLEGEDERE